MSSPAIFTKPIRQIKASDQIQQHIRDHILENNLRPGDTIPSEVELASIFGVGRPTVREAMNALAGSGLVQISSGRKPRVSVVNAAAIGRIFEHGLAIQQLSALEVLEYRRIIETGCAKLAAERATPEQRLELVKLADNLKDAEGDLKAYSEADIDFHNSLANAAMNPLVRLTVQAVAGLALESSRTGLRALTNASEYSDISRIHMDIAKAIQSGDVEATGQAMEVHFDSALCRLKKLSPKPDA